MSKIQTVQEYAISKGTTTQNVRNKKKLPLVELPIFALYKGEYIPLKKQIFVECENISPENQ